MPAMGAMLKIYDGSISKSFWTAFGYKCTKFHACTTKCTIPLYFEAKQLYYKTFTRLEEDLSSKKVDLKQRDTWIPTLSKVNHLLT